MPNSIANVPVFTDMGQLDNIKTIAKKNQKEALQKSTQQFEAIFLQMMLKSMRKSEGAFQSDLTNSDQQKFYQSMFDQQLSLSLSGKGFGLAEMLQHQLGPHGMPQRENPLLTINKQQTSVDKKSHDI